MRIQIFLEAGLTPTAVAELGQLAEGYGIDTVWASSFPARRDAFLCLSALAPLSKTVRVGVVPVSPYEIHPLRLSDKLLTLNDMASGRASIVIGGMGESIMRATGLKPERRVRAVQECVEILTGASADTELNYAGELYSAFAYQPTWAEGPAPRVYVGATGPTMLKMAGRVADGVMMSDVPLVKMPEVLANLEAGRQQSTRGVSDYRVNNFFAWHIKKDREAAIAEARRELVWRGILKQWYTEPFLGAEDAQFVEQHWEAFLQAFLQRSSVIEGVPEHLIDALVKHLTFTGGIEDIDRVVAELSAFAAAGLDEITLKIHDDPYEAVHLIGKHLIPALDA
jgi:alkanesulfonate monooxygenase SsuD/methylene tetrahydromethanopterin reductase-like flavin-dependent oxidoreductase (luciferase family)